MRKIFFLLATVSIVFNSCSSSSTEEEPEIPKLLIKQEVIGSGFTDINEYSYDSEYFWNDVPNIGNNNSIEIIYQDKKLTGAISSQNNIVVTKDLYLYNGNNISKHSRFNGTNLYYENEYTYNSNNQLISVKRTYFDSNPAVIEITDYEYDTINNTVKTINSTNPQIYTITTYDNNHHQRSGVNYFKALLRCEGNYKYNNPTQFISYSNGTVVGNGSYVNEYDSDDFISKSTFSFTSATWNNNLVSKYTYNR